MIKTAEEIKFRASGFGYLLTNPQGKSAAEKLIDAEAKIKQYTAEYGAMINKSTKTAANKADQIRKLNTQILTLQSESKEIELSETCRKQLLRIYADQVKGRREDLKSKFLDKGNERENDSITLLSRVLKKFYKKNTERKYNDFVSGEWDLHDEVEGVITETLDTKSSWSYITFMEAQEKDLNDIYETQGDCYMWLTGAKKHTVCYCLVNGTYKYITDQIRALQWKHNVLDGDISDDKDYLKAVMQLERNHIFDIDSFMKECRNHNISFNPKNTVWYDNDKDQYLWNFDIPKEERVHCKTFLRSEERIEAIKNRAILCRKYMNKKYFKL